MTEELSFDLVEGKKKDRPCLYASMIIVLVFGTIAATTCIMLFGFKWYDKGK